MNQDKDQTPARPCPICAKPATPRYRPFCSKRCADVDLNRWLSGGYAIPSAPDEEEDETPPRGAQDSKPE